MSSPKTNKARRRWVRLKTMSAPSQSWRGIWKNPDFTWSIIYILCLSLSAALVSYQAQQIPRNEKNQVITAPIVARASFRSVDEAETHRRKADARDRQPGIYQPNSIYLSQIKENLASLISLGADKSISNMEQIPQQTRQALQLDPQGWALSALQRFNAEPKPTLSWESLADQFIKELLEVPILSSERAKTERDPAQRAPRIIIRHPNLSDLERYDNVIIGAEGEAEVLRERVSGLVDKLKFPPALKPCLVAIVAQNPQALYEYNEDETNRKREAAYADEPIVERQFHANQVLIPAGRTLSEIDLKVLDQEQQAYTRQLGVADQTLRYLGVIGLSGMIAAGLWSYFWCWNHRIVRNTTRGLAIIVLLISLQLLAVLLTSMGPRFLLAAYAFPTLIATVVLAIAYDPRLAAVAGLALTAMASVTFSLPITTALILSTGVLVAASQLNEVRTRSKLIWMGLWAGLAMAAAAVLTGLVDRPFTMPQQLTAIRSDALLVLATGLATGLFIQGVLPAVETIFKVTTSMTLKDLNDASHPLLRRLAQEAPGTYQHSLRLADISEAAAQAIGANSLLCKVGAMYHDVGKTNKPLYFVENQSDGPNRHEKLSPAMSVLVIVGHVKDGVELARQYNLPSVLRHFIESHHGTTLVEYFYHAAKTQSAAQQTPAPSEFEFRYPGPKPQTREAAILMLGDCAEGAARALPDPTPVRLEHLVRTLAKKRLMDGQFDQCHLTLAELNKIEQAIVKTVCAMYHARVAYPDDSGSHTTSKQNEPRPAITAAM